MYIRGFHKNRGPEDKLSSWGLYVTFREGGGRCGSCLDFQGGEAIYMEMEKQMIGKQTFIGPSFTMGGREDFAQIVFLVLPCLSDLVHIKL